VTRQNNIIIHNSPLGLEGDDQDFTSNLSISEISPVQERREEYSLKIGNFKHIDQVFKYKSVTLINKNGAPIIVDILAGKEGVAFRYRFPHEKNKKYRII